MKALIFTLLLMPLSTQDFLSPVSAMVKTDDQSIADLAQANGLAVSDRTVKAIVNAAKRYGLSTLELAAIATIETNLGNNIQTRLNKNGTYDKGLFQINTINRNACVEYNLDSHEGSAYCAAKLLSTLKNTRSDYLGAYHSKTPSKKAIYLKKLAKVFKAYTDTYNVADNKAD